MNIFQLNKKKSSAKSENHDLGDVVVQARSLPFSERITHVNHFLTGGKGCQELMYFRSVLSGADREVWVKTRDKATVCMLMFGSNNYLGLANHPHVRQQVKRMIDQYGVGIGGPPVLNGYSGLMHRLEERLSVLKGCESTLVFTSGYSANVGLITGLCAASDTIIADEYSHASFYDGLKMFKGKRYLFRHNQIDDLEKQLSLHPAKEGGHVFVGVEGVYSMEGDLAPLAKVKDLCKHYNATLLLDDAHATGVLGPCGSGSHAHFNLKADDDIILGTFSKAFAVNGGFITGPREIIQYLRFMARSYLFSAALPPVTIAAVLAAMDVMEKEPELIERLKANVNYAADKLRVYGLVSEPQAAIVSLRVPKGKHIRQLAREFDEAGIFINSIEYPAVPKHQERFRISLMASHTREDIDKLADTVEQIWLNASKVTCHEDGHICK